MDVDKGGALGNSSRGGFRTISNINIDLKAATATTTDERGERGGGAGVICKGWRKSPTSKDRQLTRNPLSFFSLFSAIDPDPYAQYSIPSTHVSQSASPSKT